MIHHGSTRTVWLIGKWAVKFPSQVEWRLFLLGLLANMQERRFSRTGWPELCPVVLGIPGGWLLVMYRARPLTSEEWVGFDDAAFCDQSDYRVPAEPKQSSFGILNGKIVAVDYGN